ncbi:MAG TPA: LysR family transcriptional regulator [Methylomirabilota bacterium]|nr:LysR family transcriptional regulator [Methylomirabilota bacterium]
MNQPLDTRQLRAFSLLARTGSFTLAAKELYLSQSAVSHSMKALEQDVGCRLLDRVGKKVMLTQAGEHLLVHAEKILQEMTAARSALEQLGKWGRGRLRIGASTTACQYLLPTVLREFKESFARCLISIEPGDSPQAIEALRSQRIDLALTLAPRNEEQLDFHPLFSDELAFLVSPMHPWARQRHVIRAGIPRENYILYNKRSYTFRMVEEYFREEEMVLNTVIELGSMEATKELVKLGLGVSIVAPWIARKELQEASLVTLPLGKRKLRRTWGISHWKGRRLSLAEETFVSLCREAAESMGHNVTLASAA